MPKNPYNPEESGRFISLASRIVLSIPPEQWHKAVKNHRSTKPVELCKVPIEFSPAFKVLVNSTVLSLIKIQM
jgi:hypothetical protein